MLGLYVHVPFCSAICNYCNFNRGLFDADLKARYVDALIAEIVASGCTHGSAATSVTAGRTHGSAPTSVGSAPTSVGSAPTSVGSAPTSIGSAPTSIGSAPTSVGSGPTSVGADPRVGPLCADTIFFGGGTPSLLEPEEIERIIAACASSFDLAADREVTLEANPESVTEARLAAYRRAGVNRISFGVQSFRDDELRRLSRLHSAGRAREALSEARRAGFDNVSLDLMMWLPQQRVSEWLESIDAAIALAPEHISLYMLEVYPNAPLKDDMARARWSQAPDDDVAAMYLGAMERLDQAGYRQYEISNVAKPGRASRHNLKYWTDGEWLGFGCGAHSTRRGVRWKNISATADYIAEVDRGGALAVDRRCLTPDERLGDALFTGLRLVDGIDVNAIQTRYGVDVWRRFGADLEPFLEAGCLRRTESRLSLTREGMLLAHEVMSVFV